MFRVRLDRPKPHLDDKVLTAWNGLMIAAFARMARVMRGLGPEGPASGGTYLEAAQQAAGFLHDRMWNEATATLLRRYRDGDAAIDGYAEDYAFLIFGLLELFQADANPRWLQWAVTLQQRQDELFWDEADAGWFSTSGRDPSVLVRMKEEYDGAEPTASSVSLLNLLVLSHLVESQSWSEKIERTLRLFGGRLEQIGTPFQVYTHPSTVYVATFLGAANILDGKIRDGRFAVADVDLEMDAEKDLKEGDAVKLIFRPEDVFLRRPENLIQKYQPLNLS